MGEDETALTEGSRHGRGTESIHHWLGVAMQAAGDVLDQVFASGESLGSGRDALGRGRTLDGVAEHQPAKAEEGEGHGGHDDAEQDAYESLQ
jgi:hypothetical protein